MDSSAVSDVITRCFRQFLSTLK